MTELHLGDKVRVTYEGIVERSNSSEFTLNLGAGASYTHMLGSDTNVEVLEHATPKVIELSREELLVRRENIMRDLSAGYGCNPDLVDRLSEVDFLLGWLLDTKREPLVVQYGDPEPDRMIDFTDVHGGIFHWGIPARGGPGWNVPGSLYGVRWGEIDASHFPLTAFVDSTLAQEAAEVTADSPEPDRTLKYVDAEGRNWRCEETHPGYFSWGFLDDKGPDRVGRWQYLTGYGASCWGGDPAFPWTVKP